MPQWLASILIVLAGAALTAGVVIEYDQRSSSGPIAIVPTLPHAFSAALLTALALTILRIARQPWVAWWHVPLGFTFVLALGVWLILAAGKRAERKRKR